MDFVEETLAKCKKNDKPDVVSGILAGIFFFSMFPVIIIFFNGSKLLGLMLFLGVFLLPTIGYILGMKLGNILFKTKKVEFNKTKLYKKLEKSGYLNEFIDKLDEDEKILFHGFSDVSKTSKQYGRFLLGFVVLLLFWILTIMGIKNGGILNFKILVLFLTLCILTICLIYGLIYNVFLKYKKKNNEYFVTNKRIALYNAKNGLRIENISDIEHIGIAREKDNYGDISFNFYANNLIEQMKNGMSFEGVENPRIIVALISRINNRIHIYDDRPIVMGKKI